MIVAGSDLHIAIAIQENGAACNLTGASVELYYNPPSGIEAIWIPTIDSELGGLVSYDLSAIDNVRIGEYLVWARVVKQDLSVLVTGAAVFYVNRAGTVG